MDINKTELQNNIDRMREELKSMEDKLKESEREDNGIFVPVGGSGVEYYELYQNCVDGFFSEQTHAYACGVYTPVFKNKEIADAYADVFKVMMELRVCDGVSKPYNGGIQYSIDYRGNVAIWWSLDAKLTRSISPCFKTKEQAEQARDKVGKERIIKAYHTLANYKGN